MRKQHRNYQIARICIVNHAVTWIEEVDVGLVRSERLKSPFGLYDVHTVKKRRNFEEKTNITNSN